MGHLDVIRYFIDVHKCDVKARDSYNNTPLHIASRFRQQNVIQYFIEEVSMDPSITGRLLLHDACERGHLDVIKYFIEFHKCDVMARDGENSTPLHTASCFGQLKVVQYFIEEVNIDLTQLNSTYKTLNADLAFIFD